MGPRRPSPLTTPASPNGTTTFAYDRTAFDTSRRIGGGATQFLVDANRPYQEVLEEWARPGGRRNRSRHPRHGVRAWRAAHVAGDGRELARTELVPRGCSGVDAAHHECLGWNPKRWEVDYEAFGVPVNPQATSPTTYLFGGQQSDAAVSGYYLRARFMDQSIGRFFTMDTHPGLKKAPETQHPYAYALNDPVRRGDPSGKFWGAVGAFVALAVVAVCASILFQGAKKEATKQNLFGLGTPVPDPLPAHLSAFCRQQFDACVQACGVRWRGAGATHQRVCTDCCHDACVQSSCPGKPESGADAFSFRETCSDRLKLAMRNLKRGVMGAGVTALITLVIGAMSLPITQRWWDVTLARSIAEERSPSLLPQVVLVLVLLCRNYWWAWAGLAGGITYLCYQLPVVLRRDRDAAGSRSTSPRRSFLSQLRRVHQEKIKEARAMRGAPSRWGHGASGCGSRPRSSWYQ